MAALLDAMEDGRVAAVPAVVISNGEGAPGLARAAERGVPAIAIDHRRVRPRAVHEAAVVEALRAHRVDVVCLAGYMRLLRRTMIDAFPERILNIHPSLLPAFPGLHAQRQALDYGVKLAGCTVHLVDERTAHGPSLAQAAVPVRDDDDEASLAARILEQEHRIYPEALARFVAGGVRIDGRVARAPARR